MSDWQYRFPEKMREARRRYYWRNRERILEKNKKFGPYSYGPCYRLFYSIKNRCENRKFQGYKWYGGKGIRCLITIGELETLWTRDNAASMKKPTIDRIDSSKNYVFDNCRFIELSKNVSRAQKGILKPNGKIKLECLKIMVNDLAFYKSRIEQICLFYRKLIGLVDFSKRLNLHCDHKEILRHAA